MHRRDFLQTSLLGFFLAAGCTVVPIQNKKSNVTAKGKVILMLANTDIKTCTFRRYDWDTHTFEDIQVPLASPHSIVQSKFQPEIFYVFEGMGSAVRINVDTQEIIKINHLETKTFFSGHAAFGVNSEYIYCTELISGRHFTTIRSARDLSLIERLPAQLGGSHQIIALPETTLIACAMAEKNTSGRSGVTFFNTQNNEIFKFIPSDYPVGHIAAISSTEIIAATYYLSSKKSISEVQNFLNTMIDTATELTPLISKKGYQSLNMGPAPLVYFNTSGDQKIFGTEQMPDLLLNFGLNYIDKNKGFLSTHTGSNKVFLWKNFVVDKVFNTPKPTATLISHDASEFIVLGDNGEIQIFSLDTPSTIAKPLNFSRSILAISGYKT